MYSRLYTYYVTTLLLLVYVFNQLDRRVFDIVMEPIKHEFSLTDTQLGFLSGPALAVVYSLLGIPVARWADRGPRVAIMTTAIVLWSIMASLTAVVDQFWQLSLVRVGVGIGEAGFSAIAISLIGDYVSDKDRTRALSTFMLAGPLGALISNLMGGWVNEFYGWRLVFVVAGLPGILLALLMRGTVQEPPHRLVSRPEDMARPSLRHVFSAIWQRDSLRHLLIAQGLANIVPNAMGWLYVFFIRQHDMTTGELGSWFAVTDGVGGMAGIWLSGFLVTRFAGNDPRMKARLLTYAGVAVAPLALFVLWCPYKHAALLGCILLNISMYFYLAPAAALVQDLAGANMRATMASVVILFQILAGGVIGTQLVGVLSDALTPLAGNSTVAIRWSMALVAMVTLWAALHFWWAGRFIRKDLAAPPGAERGLDLIERGDVPLSP